MSQPIPRLFVSVYIDQDLSKVLAKRLREEGFDAVATEEVGNNRLLDAEQVAYAASQGRAILTANRNDFIELYNEYWHAGKTHYGIIITEQRLSVGELLKRMLHLLDSITADELMNNLKFLTEYK